MSTASTTAQTGFLLYERTLGVAAMTDRGFFYPVDIAIRGDGRIYVANRSHEGNPGSIRVTILDYDSQYYGVFGSNGEGDGQFTWPTAIVLDREGLVYVSDEYTQRISVFDADGNFLHKWGTEGSGPGELDGPAGMVFDSDDNLYVTDHRNHRVQQFTKDGRYLKSFGSHGDGDGEFNLPWGIALDGEHGIYVADWRNDRIQRFSIDGEFMASYGESGDGDGQFNRPSDVAVDRDGYIYVADWGNERVQVLDPEGGFVMKLRGEATLSPWAEEYLNANPDEAGARSRSDLETVVNMRAESPHQESSHIEKYFWAPGSVNLDNEGRLYVAERSRHRIQVYRRA